MDRGVERPRQRGAGEVLQSWYHMKEAEKKLEKIQNYEKSWMILNGIYLSSISKQVNDRRTVNKTVKGKFSNNVGNQKLVLKCEPELFRKHE